MRRFFIVFGSLVLAGVPIAYLILKAPPIEVKQLPHKNPTSFLFHSSMKTAKESVEKAFSGGSWRGMRIDTPRYELMDISMLRTESDWDYSLNCDHEPIGKSAVYFARGDSLDYLACFLLSLREQGPEQTEVMVKTLKSEVINGKQFGFGSCGPGFANRYVSVEPTTIEEFEILLRIGQALGEKDMPPLILPP